MEKEHHDQAIDDFTAEQEAELKVLMDAAVNKNADSHAMYKMPEPNPNLMEADVMTLKSKEHLQYMRSKALEMAYYTTHKLGHFTMKRPDDDGTKTTKQIFLLNIEEVKDLARNNLRFILEG